MDGEYASEGTMLAASKIQATYWMWKYRRHVWQRFTAIISLPWKFSMYTAPPSYEAEQMRKKYQDKEIKAALMLQNRWRCTANRESTSITAISSAFAIRETLSRFCVHQRG